MSFYIREIRSEEESIGNLLLVELLKPNCVRDEALKLLWIQAQEYHDDVEEEGKDRDYQNAYNSFTQVGIDADTFLKRTKVISTRFADIDEISDDLESLDSYIVRRVLNCSEICVLSDDFSAYVVFLCGDGEFLLFSWMDVI